MENKAVKTETIEDVCVVINLFKEFGYKRPTWTRNPPVIGTCVFVDYDGDILTGDLYGKEEITLPQLKDLVVLKRNDVGDATHVDTENAIKYRIINGWWHYYCQGPKRWLKSQNSNKEMETVVLIETKMSILDTGRLEMKEYLVRNQHDEYVMLDDVTCVPSEFVIEVPKGADFYAEDSNMGVKGNYFFRLRSDGFDDEAMWLQGNWMKAGFDVRNMKVLWQRHTQPEELPFIDETTYLTQGANGDHLKASIGEINNAEKIVSFDSFNLLPEFEFDTNITCGPVESDGGSSGYYFTKLPQHIIDQIVATGGIEIKDIARYVYDNNADAFNIIKAQKRIIEAKKGVGKKGASMQYDANKIVYFGNEQLNALNADK